MCFLEERYFPVLLEASWSRVTRCGQWVHVEVIWQLLDCTLKEEVGCGSCWLECGCGGQPRWVRGHMQCSRCGGTTRWKLDPRPWHRGSSAQLWVDYSPLLPSCLSHCCFSSVLQQPSLHPNTLGTHLKQIPTENIFKSTGDQKRPTISSVGECVEKPELSDDAGGNVRWNNQKVKPTDHMTQQFCSCVSIHTCG